MTTEPKPEWAEGLDLADNEMPVNLGPPPEDRPSLEAWVADKVRVIRRLRHKVRELAETEQQQIEAIAAFYENRIDKILESISYLESMLKIPVEHDLKNRKEKSIPTPYGRVGFRAIPPKIEWPEDEKLLEILKQGGIPAIKSKEIPDKKWLREHASLNADGQIVVDWYDDDGEEKMRDILDFPVTPGSQRFYVKVEDKDDAEAKPATDNVG